MIVIPFGKYRGQNIEDVNNYRYLHWLLKQEWVKEKYNNIYKYLKDNEAVIKEQAEVEQDTLDELSALAFGSCEWWN